MIATRGVPRMLTVIALAIVAVSVCGAVRPAAAADLTGCWHGCWESCSSGHQVPLNAEFCRISPTQYDVRFSGRFFKVIPFHYSVTLNVDSEDETSTTLSGSHNLGRMMGTFSYRATATACESTANYSSCKDQGRFVLGRCNSCGN